MEQYELQSSSKGWLFFVKTSFAIAILAIVVGIFMLPGSMLIKGYFGLSSLFLVNATITLSKTMRDEHESQRLINKVSEARTNQMINEYTNA